ncbi:TraR, partial [Salmonella enterica subsp. enterica serovar Heidelberg str. 77-1831]
DLADMVRNVEQGAKTAQSSSLTIAQFIGVILFLGGPDWPEKSWETRGDGTG